MSSVAELTLDQLAGGHQNHYTNLWRKYCDLPAQKVGAQMGANLLKTSGLNEAALRDIWELSDYLKMAALDQKGFFLALHLVALAQSGKAPNLQNISPLTPPPRFSDLSDNMSPAEWAEFEKKFQELPQQDGFLSGNSVKPMMMSSGLPPPALARIWQMVDTDSDGKLRVNEFCVALFLIKQCSSGQLLPQNIPSSLFIRPSSLSSGPAPSGARRPEEFTLSLASKRKYDTTFQQYAKSGDVISGQEAREVFKLSKLPVTTLADIWNLCSKKKPGFLTNDEFSLAMHLIEGKIQGREIPSSISPDFRLVSSKSSVPLPSLPPVSVGPLDYSSIKELDGFENEVKSMDQQVETLQHDVTTTQNAVAQKTAELTEIQAKLTTATGQRVQLERVRSELSSRLQEVDQNQVVLSKSLHEVQERCRAEEEEIKGLERELLERETTYKAKQDQLEEMKRHISSLKEQQDEMERQVEDRKSKIAEINQSMEDAQKELAKEHTKLKTLQEEEVSLSAQMKQLVILEAQTKDSDGQIVNLGETDNLPVDFISKDGDVNSVRATAGSSPVSSISNVSAGSAPQLDDHAIEDDFNSRQNRTRDNGIIKGAGGATDRTVKFSDEVDQTSRPDPQGAPSGVDPFKSDPFPEISAPGTDPFLMDPFSSSAPTQNTGNFDPFLSTDKSSFPGGINPFLSLDAIPTTQEAGQYKTDPFGQDQTSVPPGSDPFNQDQTSVPPGSDPFNQDQTSVPPGSDPFNQDPFKDTNIDPFGQGQPSFDPTDPFADDPFKAEAPAFKQGFETDPFAGPGGSDPFATDPFTN